MVAIGRPQNLLQELVTPSEAVRKDGLSLFRPLSIQKPTNLENKCLRFRVSGLKLKGYVFIFLNGKDYYDIYLTDLEGTVKHEIFDVDCEQLFDVLDEKIEK